MGKRKKKVAFPKDGKKREYYVKDPVKVDRELEGKYGIALGEFYEIITRRLERASLQSVALSLKRYTTTLVDG